jgi:taurine dioxygenase
MTLSAGTIVARPTAASTIEVIPTGNPLGAEVTGVDLRDLDEPAFERLMQAWHEHSVVLIRG